MTNWFAIGFAVALLYILPKRKIANAVLSYYKSRPIKLPKKVIIAIVDDVGLNFEKIIQHVKSRPNSKIIIGTQNQQKAEMAQRDLTLLTKNKNITILAFDRGNRESMMHFADEIIKLEKHVDVLINNSGQDLNDLYINFIKHELGVERFKNHCINFLSK